MLNAQDKKRVLITVVLIGIVCILMVVIAAYSAELRCENNDLIKANKALQGEIDTINVQIKTANNIENIESVATGKLGMVYPEDEECVYITDKDTPSGNFATVIKEQAYN